MWRRIVEEDMPIRIYYTHGSEVEVGGDPRKKEFLEKTHKGVKMLRMLEIPGYSRTPCFGAHVRSTGEIGKLSKLELFEGKRLRKM